MTSLFTDLPTPEARRRRERAQRTLALVLVLWFAWHVGGGLCRLAAARRTAPRPVAVDLVRDPAWRLTFLPGIGRQRAWDIVRDRQRAPPYARLEDLLRVRGIGPGTLRRLGSTRAVRVLLDGRPVGWSNERHAAYERDP